MPKFRPYLAADSSFLDSAPVHGTIQQILPVSAAAAFRCLEDPHAWPHWIGAIKRVEWTSDRPFGVGTTRDIHMTGGMVSENFYAWEDGHRMSFHFTGGTIPIFESFVEDYRLVANGEDECELIWRYGVGLRGAAKVVHPILGKAFDSSFSKAADTLAQYLTDNAARYA